MMNITKTFTQIYRLDMDGRYGEWYNTDKTYEEVVKELGCWVTGARVIEKTFNPDTFEITENVIKETETRYNWDTRENELIETIY